MVFYPFKVKGFDELPNFYPKPELLVNYQTKNDNTNNLTKSNNANIIEKHEKIIHNLKENQLKLMQKLKKSKQKYNQLLEKFTKEIKVLKKKTTKVKLENGQTVEEYIYFRDRENKVDKLKRIDCLTLLNRFGESIVI